jgi:hypothetical protein
MADNFWSQVQVMADEAPEAGFAAVNFGKLVATPNVLTFVTDENGKRNAVRTQLKPGHALGEGESLEIEFKVLISELNTALEFEYSRNVNIRKSGRVKTDWSEIVLPSLETVLGKDWAMALEKQPYVEVEDVPNIAGNTSKSGKIFGVPKLVRVFKNKTECAEARNKRFPPRENSAAVGEEETGLEFPDDVIEQAKSLIKSVGEKKARKMLTSKPFGEYEADALFIQAGGTIE